MSCPPSAPPSPSRADKENSPSKRTRKNPTRTARASQLGQFDPETSDDSASSAFYNRPESSKNKSSKNKRSTSQRTQPPVPKRARVGSRTNTKSDRTSAKPLLPQKRKSRAKEYKEDEEYSSSKDSNSEREDAIHTQTRPKKASTRVSKTGSADSHPLRDIQLVQLSERSEEDVEALINQLPSLLSDVTISPHLNDKINSQARELENLTSKNSLDQARVRELCQISTLNRTINRQQSYEDFEEKITGKTALSCELKTLRSEYGEIENQLEDAGLQFGIEFEKLTSSVDIARFEADTSYRAATLEALVSSKHH